MYPETYRYTNDHEWVGVEGDKGRVGITDYAQKQLGDIVYLDLPEVGKSFQKGDVLGSVESVKAVSEIFAPVSGVVVEVNGALGEHPEAVNKDAHGSWLDRGQALPAPATSTRSCRPSSIRNWSSRAGPAPRRRHARCRAQPRQPARPPGPGAGGARARGRDEVIFHES